MSKSWQRQLVDRLVEDGSGRAGWGYRSGALPCVEPTAMVCQALAALGLEREVLANARNWLARQQLPDGSWPISDQVSTPCWPTALAMLVYSGGNDNHDPGPRPNIEKAAAWLCDQRGRRLPFNPDVYGHDTTLEGWCWVEGTHSWVEPTAHAITTLKSLDMGDHPRVREGVRLLLDRALPDGGWNYGNTRVLDNMLRPFPATTGVALWALSGEGSNPRIESAIAYLHRELERIRTPMSLGWGLIGLTAQNARPKQARSWLAECAARTIQRRANALEDSLLLLADASWRLTDSKRVGQ